MRTHVKHCDDFFFIELSMMQVFYSVIIFISVTLSLLYMSNLNTIKNNVFVHYSVVQVSCNKVTLNSLNLVRTTRNLAGPQYFHCWWSTAQKSSFLPLAECIGSEVRVNTGAH